MHRLRPWHIPWKIYASFVMQKVQQRHTRAHGWSALLLALPGQHLFFVHRGRQVHPLCARLGHFRPHWYGGPHRLPAELVPSGQVGQEFVLRRFLQKEDLPHQLSQMPTREVREDAITCIAWRCMLLVRRRALHFGVRLTQDLQNLPNRQVQYQNEYEHMPPQSNQESYTGANSQTHITSNTFSNTFANTTAHSISHAGVLSQGILQSRRHCSLLLPPLPSR